MLPESSSKGSSSVRVPEPMAVGQCVRAIRRNYVKSSSLGEEVFDQEIPNKHKRQADEVNKEDTIVELLLDADLDRDSSGLNSGSQQHCSTPAHTRRISGNKVAPQPSLLPPPPSSWPQAPLLVRPSPNSSTRIRGIRRSRSSQYQYLDFPGGMVPINCGKEASGESWVVDFESNLFEGTLLMRIEPANPWKSSTTTYSDTSYFDGKKRRFQAVVHGRFKKPLPMKETVTGQVFHRPAGKLPPRWIVSAFLRFVTTLAPQLQVQLDGSAPCFLSPLVATAHTVLQTPWKKTSLQPTHLEQDMEEPPSTDAHSVVPLAQQAMNMSRQDNSKSSLATRMKDRKRVFNKLATTAPSSPSATFRTDHAYTFEFYQHMLDFGDTGLALDLGRPMGRVSIASATGGQPLKFMSAHQDAVTAELEPLWSFDMWHASLYPYAEQWD